MSKIFLSIFSFLIVFNNGSIACTTNPTSAATILQKNKLLGSDCSYLKNRLVKLGYSSSRVVVEE